MKIERFAYASLLSLLLLGLIENVQLFNLGIIMVQAFPASVFVPNQKHVLLILGGRYVNEEHGNGRPVADLAYYGFNVTLVSEQTIDYTTDPRTSNLSKYDAVFVYGQYFINDSPIAVTEDEVYHFVNYNGYLVVFADSLQRNETDATWFGFDSAPINSLESRLGITFVGFAKNEVPLVKHYQHNNQTLENSTFSGYEAPDYINQTDCYVDGQGYLIKTSLNGASEIYRMHFNTTSNTMPAVTYYENATGAKGSYIAMQPMWIAGDEFNRTQLCGTKGASQRRDLYRALLCYAFEMKPITTIMPQKIAVFRSDDWGFFYTWNDSQHVEAFDNIQSVEAEFPQHDIKHTFACWTNGFSIDKTTVERLRQAQKDGDELAFHLGILGDTATYDETMQAIQADVNKREECNLEPAETSIANGGKYGDASTQAYRDYGTWVNEGTTSYHPKDWYLYRYNQSILWHDATQQSAGSAETVYERYYNWRGMYAMQSIKTAYITFYLAHVDRFLGDNWGSAQLRCDVQNVTYDLGNIRFLTQAWATQYWANPFAKITNAERTGDTITFMVSVDDFPISSLPTVGKGMLWFRIDTEDSKKIKSVMVDGSSWHVFDDYSIRIPAESSQIEVTLGTPDTPYIKDANKKITSTSYASGRLTFMVSAFSGVTSTTKVYCGDNGKPPKVLIYGIEQLVNYNSSTKTLTITATHSSNPAEIVVDWNRYEPNASFVYSPLNPYTNDTVTFNASDSKPNGGDIISYQWDFGDGFGGKDVIVTHVYDAAGTYRVTLNVTDSEGLWNSTAATVTVKTPAPPSIWKVEYSPELPEYNEVVTITANITSHESGIGTVTLNYFNGSGWTNITMTMENDLYVATIPVLPYGTTVQYKVYASNDVRNWTETNTFNYTVADTIPPDVGPVQWSPIKPSAGEEVLVSTQVSEPAFASGVKNITLLWSVNGKEM